MMIPPSAEHQFSIRDVLICRKKIAVLLFLAAAATLAPSAHASTFKWIEPTQAELAMTEYPKAPGAPAVFLSFDETDNIYNHEVDLHVRIKVLNESGLDAANIQIPSNVGDNNVFEHSLYARTIHPDGSIIPFTGKPLDQRDSGSNTKLISMPGVTVGSIIEYGYHIDGYVLTLYVSSYAPLWIVQNKYFVCTAHYVLNFEGVPAESVHWVARLPPGVEVSKSKNKAELKVTDIAARPDEEFMPPEISVRQFVNFYSWNGDRNNFWSTTGGNVDRNLQAFYQPTKVVTEAAKQLVSPQDSDEQKLHKLYDAIMAFENTDLTRQRSVQEDKAVGLKKEVRSSEDIWLRKRGSSDELTLLFIALARGAGYQAYPMAVVPRDNADFNPDVLNWYQMKDLVAVVVANGRERFFDPGTRDCPFGHLAWWHINAGGITFQGKSIKMQYTPNEAAGTAHTVRQAALKIDAQGNVEGNVTITWTSMAALNLRRLYLQDDRQAAENSVTESLQHSVPRGVQVKLSSLKGLDTYNDQLVATFDLSGKIGNATGKRLLVPTAFFNASSQPILSAQTRTFDINFKLPYVNEDTFLILFPPSIAIEAAPEPKAAGKAKELGYQVSIESEKNRILIHRIFYLRRTEYKIEDYPVLHQFFADVAAGDQSELIFHTSTASTQPSPAR